jgi:hypothetical protein
VARRARHPFPIVRNSDSSGGQPWLSDNAAALQMNSYPESERRRAMIGSRGGGFVIDTATIFLVIVGFLVVAGIWMWLR